MNVCQLIISCDRCDCHASVAAVYITERYELCIVGTCPTCGNDVAKAMRFEDVIKEVPAPERPEAETREKGKPLVPPLAAMLTPEDLRELHAFHIDGGDGTLQ